MARKYRWWDDLPRKWWIEKLLVPSLLVVVTGIVTTIVAPQVLYLRDQKLASDAMRRALIEETAAENAALTNAAWAHEDALDAAFERAFAAQTQSLYAIASAACGHNLAAPDAVVKVSTGPDDWIAANIVRYHDLFRAHQVWATRSRVRLQFLLKSDSDAARREFDALELALGAYETKLQARRSAYDDELRKRDAVIRTAIAAVHAGKREHESLHEWFDITKASDSSSAILAKQETVDHVAASKAQDRLFAVFQAADVAPHVVAGAQTN